MNMKGEKAMTTYQKQSHLSKSVMKKRRDVYHGKTKKMKRKSHLLKDYVITEVGKEGRPSPHKDGTPIGFRT